MPSLAGIFVHRVAYEREAIEMARRSKMKRQRLYWFRRMETLSKRGPWVTVPPRTPRAPRAGCDQFRAVSDWLLFRGLVGEFHGAACRAVSARAWSVFFLAPAVSVSLCLVSSGLSTLRKGAYAAYHRYLLCPRVPKQGWWCRRRISRKPSRPFQMDLTRLTESDRFLSILESFAS